MKNKFLTFLLLFACINVFSQNNQNLFIKKTNGYNISGNIKNLSDTSLMLAYYFAGKQYSVDTAYSKNGKFVFSGEKPLDGGMYLIVLPNQKYFDIIITEQDISFSSDLNDLISNMKFDKSKENTPFYEYLNFITNKQKEVSPLRTKE